MSTPVKGKINKEHPDYSKYAKEFDVIARERNEKERALDALLESYRGKGDPYMNERLEAKKEFVQRVTALQMKYSYLWD